jgi:hypothetical protein
MTIFQNASQWLRADFHLHTRADKEFKYSGEENSFVNDYVQALKQAEIQIGVITNHNKFDYNEFKALRKKAKKEDIFLLPGVELSVNDGANGIHTLVVFSDAWLENGNDYINQFLNVTFLGKVPSEYEQENGRSSDSLIETIKKLESYHKDFFLVFAHVEQKSGLWEELEGGRLEELAQNEYFHSRCLGFQKVRTHDKADKKCRVKVKQWFKNKDRDYYPAEVEGSDCKAIEQIEKGEACYLKIGDFNFSAVKYALMDYQHRVAKEKPIYKHSYIKSISFTGGALDGKTIHLSPELNNLIGIRGSGKSFILEALRYGLNISFGEKAGDTDYKEKLIKSLLGSSGKITIQAVNRFGQCYEIHRILNQLPDIYQNDIKYNGISISETILNKPIYFGQKDLSNTGEGFEKDLIEKIIGDKLADIRLKISNQQQKVKDFIQRFQKFDTLKEKEQEWRNKESTAKHQLEVYQNYGIEEKLQKQLDFEADNRKLVEIKELLNNFFNEFEQILSTYESSLELAKNYQSKQNQDFFADFFTIYAKVLDFVLQTQQNIQTNKILFDELNAKIQQFEFLKLNLKEEFADIERNVLSELKQQNINEAIDLAKFHHIKNTIAQSTQILQEIEKQQQNRKSLIDAIKTELDILENIYKNEFELIKSELDKINKNHSSLKIEVEYQQDKVFFKSFMQDIFRGSNIRQTTYDSLVEKYKNFREMYSDLANIKYSLNNADMFAKVFRDNLPILLTTQINNKFIINYQNKELKQHSLGQRASALILFILSQQENDVIIIDQPEDDLDNQTIYQDVIKLIRQLKPKTQFIFATHNANFPVLGDSEQVISCQYNQQEITFNAGNIDSPDLQKAIVAIMEGGEEAFNKRRDIYQQWKP